MMRSFAAASLLAVTALAAAPASACAVHVPLNLNSALGADLVVTGRIVNLRTDAHRNQVFDIAVSEVLRGRAGRLVTVSDTGGMPGLRQSSRRPVLAALRRQGGGYAILAHICSDPFLLDASSANATATRRLLARPR